MTAITILGCGSSGGVPRIGGDWGVCDPNQPRNRRLRSSALFWAQEEAILIDTAPDLREQLLRHDIKGLRAVLYTHAHADQLHGLDDVRPFIFMTGKPIAAYADASNAAIIQQSFSYAFQHSQDGHYHPILQMNVIALEPFMVPLNASTVTITPFACQHGSIIAMGYRMGDIAYSPDVHMLPEASFDILSGVKIWVVDCLQYRPHPTHAHLERVLEWHQRVKPALMVLTNLHIHMDYQTLCDSLPPGIIPAYDGLHLDEADF